MTRWYCTPSFVGEDPIAKKINELVRIYLIIS